MFGNSNLLTKIYNLREMLEESSEDNLPPLGRKDVLKALSDFPTSRFTYRLNRTEIFLLGGRNSNDFHIIYKKLYIFILLAKKSSTTLPKKP